MRQPGNTNRQLTGILFYVPRLSFAFGWLRQVPLSELPVSPGGSTAQGSSARIVELQRQGQRSLPPESGQGTSCATRQTTHLEIRGTPWRCWVFPHGDSPMLEDAVFHRLGHEQALEPLA
jgi:hypothetical protein